MKGVTHSRTWVPLRPTVAGRWLVWALLLGVLIPAPHRVGAQVSQATGIPAGVDIVVGRVVQGEDSVPVPGAVVYGLGSDAVAVADSSGVFRLMLPAGVWTILSYASQASDTSWALPGVLVTLEEGVVLRADIRLDRAEVGTPMNPFALRGLTVDVRSPEETARLREGSYVDVLDSDFLRSRENAARHIGDVIRGHMRGVRVLEGALSGFCIEPRRRWPRIDPGPRCHAVAVVLDGALVVEDGMMLLRSIPVSAIEEVRYLSSTAAAAAYGTAGTNGVLIVTTRTGGG